jgi:hypothetical protein
LGRTYARGAYIAPYFAERQNRLSPLEALFSAFLYRASPLTKAYGEGGDWYYQTATLSFYRERFEEKASSISAEIVPVPGTGAGIKTVKKGTRKDQKTGNFFSGVPPKGAGEFLREYKAGILSLTGTGEPGRSIFPGELSGKNRMLLATVLPLAAAIKGRGVTNAALFEALGAWCASEIDRVLAAWGERP